MKDKEQKDVRLVTCNYCGLVNKCGEPKPSEKLGSNRKDRWRTISIVSYVDYQDIIEKGMCFNLNHRKYNPHD